LIKPQLELQSGTTTLNSPLIHFLKQPLIHIKYKGVNVIKGKHCNLHLAPQLSASPPIKLNRIIIRIETLLIFILNIV